VKPNPLNENYSTKWKCTSKFKPTSKAGILESETCYLRMGGCGESSMTMSELTKHVLGLPIKLEWHPFRYIDFSEQAGVKKHQQVPVKNI
jgi:hypothetical protein